MISFEIDLKKIKNYLNLNYEKTEKYKDSLNIFMNSINNVDTVWNDNNTEVFIDIINSDKKKFLEHIESTEKYLDIINNFCLQLNEIVRYNLKKNNIKKLKYNSYYILKSINSLKNFNDKLNLIINDLENISLYIKNSNEKQIMKNICLNFKKYKNIIENLIKVLQKLTKDIEKLLNDTNYKINKINFVNFDSNKLEYKFNGEFLDFKKN